jgi:hypothetical protein
MGIFDSFKGKRLIKALKDEDVTVRTNAADALGEMGELAVEPLIDALNDISGDVRGTAARSLGMPGRMWYGHSGRSGILALSDTFCRL